MTVARRGMLFCLVGPAGGGKTSFCRKLEEAYGASVRCSVSVTSRPARPDEIKGKSYVFVTRADFERLVRDGEFFEWEENHGNYYGTLRSTVEETLRGGIDLLLTIDIRGALNFKKSFPQNTVITFIVPPSTAALRERLRGRGEISDLEFRTRLATATREYRELLDSAGSDQIDYLLVNDSFDVAFAGLRAILDAERHRLVRISAADLARLGDFSGGDT